MFHALAATVQVEVQTAQQALEAGNIGTETWVELVFVVHHGWAHCWALLSKVSMPFLKH